MCSSTNKISQPGDMVTEATSFLQNAISCIVNHSQEDIDDNSMILHFFLRSNLSTPKSICQEEQAKV